MNIKTVTVVGANGTLGSLVSGIIAAFGNADVHLISRSHEKSVGVIEKIVKSVRGDAIRCKLHPGGYDKLEECVQKSDWVFESVAEDINVKLEINTMIAKSRRPGTIVTTGTSGLSIGTLKDVFDEDGQKHYFGTHFFNPPYNLLLCEVIGTESSDEAVMQKMEFYLEHVLRRKTVRIKDRPGFYGNRVGFQFLNEAMQFAEKYKEKGGVDYIDAILGPFTGRAMSPIATADFVGLDVHKAIVDNLLEKTNDFAHKDFIFPEYCVELVKRGKLGRKSKEGLYGSKTDDKGKRMRLVYDIATDELRPIAKYDIPFAKKMVEHLREGEYTKAMSALTNDITEEAKICRHFLIKYILYSAIVSEEIASLDSDADICMAFGFNWIPPFAFMEAFGGVHGITAIVNQEPESWDISKEDFDKAIKVLTDAPKSIIDYRRYLRAKF